MRNHRQKISAYPQLEFVKTPPPPLPKVTVKAKRSAKKASETTVTANVHTKKLDSWIVVDSQLSKGDSNPPRKRRAPHRLPVQAGLELGHFQPRRMIEGSSSPEEISVTQNAVMVVTEPGNGIYFKPRYSKINSAFPVVKNDKNQDERERRKKAKKLNSPEAAPVLRLPNNEHLAEQSEEAYQTPLQVKSKSKRHVKSHARDFQLPGSGVGQIRINIWSERELDNSKFTNDGEIHCEEFVEDFAGDRLNVDQISNALRDAVLEPETAANLGGKKNHLMVQSIKYSLRSGGKILAEDTPDSDSVSSSGNNNAAKKVGANDRYKVEPLHFSGEKAKQQNAAKRT